MIVATLFAGLFLTAFVTIPIWAPWLAKSALRYIAGRTGSSVPERTSVDQHATVRQHLVAVAALNALKEGGEWWTEPQSEVPTGRRLVNGTFAIYFTRKVLWVSTRTGRYQINGSDAFAIREAIIELETTRTSAELPHRPCSVEFE